MLKTIYQAKAKGLFYELELDDKTLRQTIINQGRRDIRWWRFENSFQTKKAFRQKLNRKRRQGYRGLIKFVSDSKEENKDSRGKNKSRKIAKRNEKSRPEYIWILGRKLPL
jgi:hypothetical protein